MNLKIRQKKVKEEFEIVENILEKKGRDYSGEDDALANFKNDRLGLTKFQNWGQLLNKHVDAINNSVKRNPEFPERYSESIKESLRDIIGYAVLGICLIDEDEEKNKIWNLPKNTEDIEEQIDIYYRDTDGNMSVLYCERNEEVYFDENGTPQIKFKKDEKTKR